MAISAHIGCFDRAEVFPNDTFTTLILHDEDIGSEATIFFHGENHEQRARIAAAALNGIDPEPLADLIEEGMDGVHDMGTTFSDYAKAAAENVLKHLGKPA